ncbi:hypothetical protein BGZ63DRAFT_188745 [Mariannaea sp. PMI_226]|nr:hypothetical protein BGZ63DRAFT_188745 [Mariannaea sp. PMI_226]
MYNPARFLRCLRHSFFFFFFLFKPTTNGLTIIHQTQFSEKPNRVFGSGAKPNTVKVNNCRASWRGYPSVDP